MALWNKNGYSQDPDEQEADFDLILSDEDFEDEEEPEEIIAESGSEEDDNCGAVVYMDESNDCGTDVCTDESDDCVDDVEEYYDMDSLQVVDSVGVYSAAGDFTGEDASEEFDLNEDSIDEYIIEDFGACAEEEDQPVAADAEQNFGEGIQIMDPDAPEEEGHHTSGAFLLSMSKKRMAVGSALLALVIVVVAAVAVVTGRGSESVNAFSAVSSSLEDVDVIGGEALAELMTSKETEYQATFLSAAETETVSKEYEETETTEDKITVSLVMTSVEKDLKIKFTNKATGKLIANIPFEVKVVDGNGNVTTWTNDDKDGIIYKSGLAAGTYTVSLIALEGDLYENYDFSASGTVTVRDTIAYEKVDVSAEIKDETEINVASEEAQVVQVVESVNTDTVEWVESTKTLSSEEYTVIDKTLIAVPTASSVSRSFLATASTNITDGEAGVDSTDTDSTVSEEVTGTTSEAETAASKTVSTTSETAAAASETEATASEADTTIVPEETSKKLYSDVALTAAVGSAALTVGDTTTISAQINGADASESWSYTYVSSNTGVAAVDSNGKVTANAAGEATITVTAACSEYEGTAPTASCTVTVSQSYSDFSLSLSSSSLSLNKNISETVTVTPQNTTSGESITYTYASSDTSVAEVYGSDNTVTVKAVGAGTATINVSACYTNNTSKTATASFTVTVTSSSTALKTTDGRAVYVLENGSYRTATYDDYYTDGMAFYVRSEGYIYTGWQTIDGNTYYYTADGNYVVGDQVIQGVQYTFSSTGVLQDGSGTLGIDVSSHNGSIDWTAVKNSGVSYAIIRCGYRGYGSGVLVEDSRFRSNIQGALNAGLKVGVYFFSQAVTTTEAVEEASMVLQLISGYSISLPVYIDVEYSNSSHSGRADSLGVSDRTAIVKAFCQTIQNSGYTAGIYANKTWLTSYLNMSQLSSYKVWLAQYAASPTYTGSYHMWQYSSSGSISGISGNVDLNLWYY
ncbi:MAG: Ig-like domain-containing protein [Lachnospiraceae bacterium]|nr:Ig-like domain-containing protein [Lachnospiraceae bacterium]